METIEYKLKSFEGNSILIPEEYDKKASELVKDILKAETTGEFFFNSIYNEIKCKNSPYPYDGKLLPKAIDLMFEDKNSPKSLKLQDELYLRTCMCLYANDKSLNKAGDKAADRNKKEIMEAMKVAGSFIYIIEMDKPFEK